MKETRERFLVHLRGALGGLNPTPCEDDHYAPRSELDVMDASIQSGFFWLSIYRFDSFDPTDFPELSSDAANRVPGLIQIYSQAAQLNHSDQTRLDPETLKQASNALLELGRIFRLLQ